jgi:hypothetical protein
MRTFFAFWRPWEFFLVVDRPWGQLSYSGDHRKGPRLPATILCVWSRYNSFLCFWSRYNILPPPAVTGYYWPPGHETFTFRPLFTKIFTAQMGRGKIQWDAFTIPNRRLFRTLREKLIITTVTSNFVKHDFITQRAACPRRWVGSRGGCALRHATQRWCRLTGVRLVRHTSVDHRGRLSSATPTNNDPREGSCPADPVCSVSMAS